MFGKPEWFREKTLGWGLSPVSWQGWLYTLIWATVLAGPTIGLIATAKFWEALVWLAVAMGLLIWDVWQIIAQMREAQREHDVFVIDETTDAEQISTEKYEFRLRDQ